MLGKVEEQEAIGYGNPQPICIAKIVVETFSGFRPDGQSPRRGSAFHIGTTMLLVPRTVPGRMVVWEPHVQVTPHSVTPTLTQLEYCYPMYPWTLLWTG